MTDANYNPFDLSQLNNGISKSVIRVISRIDVLERWYNEWLQQPKTEDTTDQFISYALKTLDISIEVKNKERLDTIPPDGPFICVANHPLGGLEGMILTQILRRIRPDLKVLTNQLLSSIPEFSDTFIGVDVLNQGRTMQNAKGMREVTSHLSKGGALLVFPAGTVSRLKLPSLKISDAPWNTMVSRLSRKFNVPIMPVFIEGQNSIPFYLSAYIHKRLRTAMLPRAMIKKMGETIKLHIGQTIPASDVIRLDNDIIATQYIRLCCKIMKVPTQTDDKNRNVHMDNVKKNICTETINNHLRDMRDCLLLEKGDLELYCAPYNRLGPVQEQLSIVRERTFRTVDEGTGKELDRDQFDPHYTHLFLWDKENQQIAGGYRLGKTDEIHKSLGLNGLYSHSLFDYNEAFLKNMGETIEVGRSFIAQDYQKNPSALDMLWKGIGHYVVQNPKYHILFGCVSISRQYSNLASAMLTETFLSHYSVKNSISRKVKARSPLKKFKNPWSKEQLAQLSQIPIINKLVGRIDPGKAVPILIRHYLALNGRFISFTVNNGFNDSLDGLIMVDLRNTPKRYLKRYMGDQGMKNFLDVHFDNENKIIQKA